LVLASRVLASRVLVLVLERLGLTWGGGGFPRTLSGTGGMRLSTARGARCRCPWPMAGRG
jgi:hypothetical protein